MTVAVALLEHHPYSVMMEYYKEPKNMVLFCPHGWEGRPITIPWTYPTRWRFRPDVIFRMIGRMYNGDI